MTRDYRTVMQRDRANALFVRSVHHTSVRQHYRTLAMHHTLYVMHRRPKGN
jgi:hypothetical protein